MTARLLVVFLLALSACAPMTVPAGPRVAVPQLTNDSIVAADGTVLPLRAWLPSAGAPRAAIIALHGFNDYSNFFDKPGQWLAAKGVAAYAYDQRGFGRAGQRGLWPGIETLGSDLTVAVNLIRARHPGVPLYLLGESMGGAVVIVTMGRPDAPPVDGIILSAPAVWGRTTMPFYQRFALSLGAYTVPWMTLTGRGLKIQASDNIEMLRALGRDPLVIKETRIDAIHGLADLMDEALEKANRLDVPALVLYGHHDQIIPEEPTRMMLDSLPPKERGQTRVAHYDRGWHMLLRDLQAETVWSDISRWVDDRTAPLPSGAEAGVGRFIAAPRPAQRGLAAGDHPLITPPE